jgi:hypothetical protein
MHQHTGAPASLGFTEKVPKQKSINRRTGTPVRQHKEMKK